MEPIRADEIRALPDYERVRDDLRARIIALKKHRRLHLGDRLSLVFENRETMLWQIHEMVRAERLDKPEAVAAECAVYSKLLPSRLELSATLFVEIDQSENIRAWLDALRGLDEHLALWIDDARIAGAFDPSQYSTERISAVHYVRFHLSETQRQRFLDPRVPARLAATHPAYRAETAIVGETRRSLGEDLR